MEGGRGGGKENSRTKQVGSEKNNKKTKGVSPL
jgi:hypothetical protein